MDINEVEIQVRFNEMDEMGIVHNSVYYIWFEIARYNFAMKALGIQYQDLKDMGVLVPVIHSECQFKRPAVYPDQLKVSCFLEPTDKAILILHYKIVRVGTNELIAVGKTMNAFTDMNGRLRVTLPEFVKKAIKETEMNSRLLWRK